MTELHPEGLPHTGLLSCFSRQVSHGKSCERRSHESTCTSCFTLQTLRVSTGDPPSTPCRRLVTSRRIRLEFSFSLETHSRFPVQGRSVDLLSIYLNAFRAFIMQWYVLYFSEHHCSPRANTTPLLPFYPYIFLASSLGLFYLSFSLLQIHPLPPHEEVPGGGDTLEPITFIFITLYYIWVN